LSFFKRKGITKTRRNNFQVYFSSFEYWSWTRIFDVCKGTQISIGQKSNSEAVAPLCVAEQITVKFGQNSKNDWLCIITSNSSQESLISYSHLH
jgi:hypothetical protein